MSKLCPEAEQYLIDHPERKLTEEQRRTLSQYSPDEQVRWLVNYYMQLIKATFFSSMFGFGYVPLQTNTNPSPNNNNNNNTPAPPVKPAPVEEPEEPEEPMFNLFD